MKITLLSPAWPYRGGIAAFSERLAREFIAEGHTTDIVTFTLQYPSFLFPGKTQYSPDPAPKGLRIRRMLNSVNPLNWIKTGRRLRRESPDLLVIAFWMPYMAPCLGAVSRIVRSNGHTRVAAVVHNLIPHEKHPGDSFLAGFFCRSADHFTALSKAVEGDIKALSHGKPCSFCPHPTYDNYGAPVPREEACLHLGLDPGTVNLLFFGLIRDYKGLDLLLEAYAGLKERARLVVAGEFYSDGEKYHSLARSLGIDSEVIWRTEFVPDSEVRYYFSAADLVVLPY